MTTTLDAKNSNQKQCFDYDELDRLTSGVATGGTGGTYALQNYIYDGATGNLASKAGVSYTYGDANHDHAVTQAGTNSYSYDANGNQTSRPGYTLSYDAENRLVSVAGTNTTTYTYDGDGNRVKSSGSYMNLATGIVPTSDAGLSSAQVVTDNDPWADSSSQYAQSTTNGLHYVKIDLGAVYSVNKVVLWHYANDGRTYHSTKTQVSANGTTWVTVYDSAVSGEYQETPQGKEITFSTQNVRYIRDYVNGNTVNANDHWTEIEAWGYGTVTTIGNYLEWTGSTSTMVKYYYAGNTRVAMRRGTSTLYWLFGDHLGSQSITTNSSGEKFSEVRYYPWGEERYPAYTNSTAYRFTGQKTELGLGLMYYGARFYDPALGRFIQADTDVPESQGVQALDRYAYVNNSPVNYTDPSGHMMTQCGADNEECGATLAQINYETQRYYYENCSSGYGGGCPDYAEAIVFTGLGLVTAGVGEPVFDAVGGAIAETVTTATTAACADGDCTNEGNFVVKTANQLKEEISEAGLQIHHIIEQRFAPALHQSYAQTQNWLSVELTPQIHQGFTNAWRSQIGYINQAMQWTTENATPEIIWKAAQYVYKDFPELLDAAWNTIFGK